MRTYQEADCECDFYAVEVFESTLHKVGRDFFEFVQGFYVGTQMDEFPELLRIMMADDRQAREDWEKERHPGVFSPMRSY
ncbi:hypothetical protein IQ241_08765 [Romeria aff. gracilis LEGE 07310]|uniref:Uncharacterized protein n=1 Tax=Vasconcelosia minhoensis LEGE 07310 TaxID=915328 RepID=A0A8J7A671_9CYAN|nr:hypothetical protein [Romeria gracilis]MBE9077387.1 hypothetical protein [Romeria aff. gracilis LEGE 07310]